MHTWRNGLALAAIVFSPLAMAQREMQPGNWHIVTHATTNGKADPVQEQDECLKDELKDLAGYFSPGLEGVEAKCTRTPQKAPANSIAYKMRCTGNGFTADMESQVNVVDSKRFTATLKMDTKAANEHSVVTARIEGVHTGDCKR
jgi:hypothetical protein